MLFRRIVKREKDLAGNFRVWSEVDDGEIMMMKFDTNLLAAQVEIRVNSAILKLVREQKRHRIREIIEAQFRPTIDDAVTQEEINQGVG